MEEGDTCCVLASIAPVISIILSARVDLPWSTCEMMQKFRILSAGISPAVARSSSCEGGEGREETEREEGRRSRPFREESPAVGHQRAVGPAERWARRGSDIDETE